MSKNIKKAQDCVAVTFSGTWEWRSEAIIPILPESFFGLYLKSEEVQASKEKIITGHYIYKKKGRKIADTFEFTDKKYGIRGASFNGKALLLEILDENNQVIGEAGFELMNDEQNSAIWTLNYSVNSSFLPKKRTLKRMRSLPRYY